MRKGENICTLVLAVLIAPILSGQGTAKYFASQGGTDKSECVMEKLTEGVQRRCAIVITILRSDRSLVERITLPIEIAIVRSLKISPHGHLVVLGDQRGGFQRFLVYDIQNKRLLTNQLCSFPSVAPTGLWITYQRFIPPHGMEPLSVDLRMYSVDAMRLAVNREEQSVFRGPEGSWIFASPRWSPSGNLAVWGVNAKMPTELVLISRTSGKLAPHFSVKSIRIALGEVCRGNESLKKPGRCDLSVEQMQFHEKSKQMIVTFRRLGEHGYDRKSVVYSFGEVRPEDGERDKTERNTPNRK